MVPSNATDKYHLDHFLYWLFSGFRDLYLFGGDYVISNLRLAELDRQALMRGRICCSMHQYA